MIDVDGVELVNVKIIQETGPALTIFNSSNVSVSNFQFDTIENKPGVVVAGAVSENIKLNRADFADPAAQVITIGGASKEAVTLN